MPKLDGYAKEIHDSLLHYMKSQSFYEYFKKYLIPDFDDWCPFTHGDEINCECYRSNPSVYQLLIFLERYQLYNRFLQSNRYHFDEFTRLLNLLQSPETIRTCEDFKQILSEISDSIEGLDKEIQQKINNFTCDECIRLDESLVNYSNNCRYSTIIMAVSAIELRLHRMIKNLDNKRYTKEFGKATLGQIVSQFDESAKYDDIKKLMPQKHLPLIQLLNQYRVFAVHPKNELISPVIVDSILALSFAFITDPEISVYEKEDTLCTQESSK